MGCVRARTNNIWNFPLFTTTRSYTKECCPMPKIHGKHKIKWYIPQTCVKYLYFIFRIRLSWIVILLFIEGRIPFRVQRISLPSSTWKKKQACDEKMQNFAVLIPQALKTLLLFTHWVKRISFSCYWPSRVIRIGLPVWKWKNRKISRTKGV